MTRDNLLQLIPHKLDSKKGWVCKNKEFAKIETLLLNHKFSDQELEFLEKRIQELCKHSDRTEAD